MRVFSAVGVCLIICGLGVVLVNDYTGTGGLNQEVPVKLISLSDARARGSGGPLQGSISQTKTTNFTNTNQADLSLEEIGWVELDTNQFAMSKFVLLDSGKKVSVGSEFLSLRLNKEQFDKTSSSFKSSKVRE